MHRGLKATETALQETSRACAGESKWFLPERHAEGIRFKGRQRTKGAGHVLLSSHKKRSSKEHQRFKLWLQGQVVACQRSIETSEDAEMKPGPIPESHQSKPHKTWRPVDSREKLYFQCNSPQLPLTSQATEGPRVRLCHKSL